MKNDVLLLGTRNDLCGGIVPSIELDTVFVSSDGVRMVDQDDGY